MNCRAASFALLASTALSTPAFSQTVQPTTTGQSPAPGTNTTIVTSPPARVQQRQDGVGPDQTEIVITATKREENVQNVPINVIALGTRRLDQLNISNFEDYTKQLPSVSFLTTQPGQTTVYMRGVSAAGGTNAEGNHSGPLPQVGTYLDEQPVTTIGGTLDIHIYDVARIESLSGPQGTLYGASSEAGTIRIITNKPELGITIGRVDGEINSIAHGGVGGKLEGMINFPVATRIAFRGVAFYERDAGFIDNIFGSRTYYTNAGNIGADIPPSTVTNAGLEKNNFNTTDIYGGRAALKIDLDDNWTATPTFMYQKTKSQGVFFYDPALGDLKIDRFRPEPFKDRFWQAALTVEGKIANFDVTYAGAYMDRPNSGENDYADYTDAYDRLYASVGGLAYFYYQDAAGNPLRNPQQYILFTNHFKKMSHELRIASPADKPFRVIAGAFLQHQSNFIHQDYRVDGLAPNLSVNGFPGTLWLTQQKRVDRDYALFGEASWDIVPTVTLTAGGRLFRYDNSLVGFFGFGRDPAYITGPDGSALPGSPPPNAAGSSRTGVAACFTQSGDSLRDSQQFGTDTTLLPPAVSGSPCTDLGVFENGTVVPKHAKGSGFTHRLNLQWKPQQNLMFYATWSRGFRPGGINRRAEIAPYAPDYLTNFELGWKTTFGPLRWNGDVFHETWTKFQFAFLGANSFTEIHNGRDARINGVETDISYIQGGLTLNAAAAYTDAKTKGAICTNASDTSPDCSLDGDFPSVPSGTRLPITPKFKGTATARYTWPVWAAVKAHVQGSVTYRGSAPSSLRTQILLAGPSGDQILANPNVFQGDLRPATLVDLYAGLDWPKWNVEAFVSNVFDKRDDLSRQTACASCTRVLVVPGRPRTIGIRAGMKF
ncbi:MAG TPA: TonB-dependent receptor [Sphingomicrobium sp.]|nr:TonB-dependent receptor [Sphingomicrobium sp.]